jgi:hypothetical protein
MLSEVMEFFGFRRPLDHLGFFETPKQKDLEQEIEKVLLQGRLIAIAGIVGLKWVLFLFNLV